MNSDNDSEWLLNKPRNNNDKEFLWISQWMVCKKWTSNKEPKKWSEFVYNQQMNNDNKWVKELNNNETNHSLETQSWYVIK